MADDDDGELLARLKRLDARPELPAQHWETLAAGVRTAYEQASAAPGGERRPARRAPRRSFALAASALALAAALVLWLRPHRAIEPLPTMEPGEELGAFGGEIPIGEQIEDLDDAQLDRLSQALKQGA